MAEAPPPLDPFVADDLNAGLPDPARIAALPSTDDEAVARAAAAFANGRGGDILIGAALNGDGTLTVSGVPAADAETGLARGLHLVDPPIEHLVRTRAVETEAGCVLVARVRMSPSTPHIVMTTGAIPRMGPEGARLVSTRRELDDLYARGRGERERADRLVDAMIEKLTLAHYAFYNLAIVACTHDPSAEPYSAAAGGMLAPEADAFVSAFGLHEHEPSVRPGEIELRTPGETGAYLRVTRSGCVAAGEVQRRPYHEELDNVDHLRGRIEVIAAATCRLLAHAPDAVVVPHLFVEGVRGLRLVFDPATRKTSTHAPQDTARYALTLGDAADPSFPARLATEAVSRLESLFPLPAG
jgi:hypothetical protein